MGLSSAGSRRAGLCRHAGLHWCTLPDPGWTPAPSSPASSCTQPLVGHREGSKRSPPRLAPACAHPGVPRPAPIVCNNPCFL